jgi:hypothetical protein
MADYSREKKVTDEVLRIGARSVNQKRRGNHLHKGGLHVTIGVAPPPSLSIEQELRLVKAALLYADHVELCSPAASMILSVAALQRYTMEQKIRLMEQVAEVINPQQAPDILAALATYKGMRKRKDLPKPLLLIRSQFDAFFARNWSDIASVSARIVTESGADGVSQAISSGFLELYTFDSLKNPDGMVEEFVKKLGETIEDSTTFPLFDDQAGGIVRAALQEGAMEVSNVIANRGKHVALAADLFARLPLFDQATVKDILDIRRELDGPLIRFRKAMASFSDSIKAAQWDVDFPVEAEALFYREVEPAVTEIEEAIKSNRFLKELANRVLDKPITLPATSALGIGLGQLHLLPAIASAAFGTTIGAAHMVGGAYQTWQEKTKTVERNQLFLYYRARQRLTEMSTDKGSA